MQFVMNDKFLIEMKVYDFGENQVGIGIEGSATDILWINNDELEQEVLKHDKNKAKLLIQRQIDELQKKLEGL